MAKKEQTFSFEQKLEELDGIITALEGEDVTLENLLKEYEKGVSIAAALTEKLKDVQNRLSVLSGGKIEEAADEASL